MLASTGASLTAVTVTVKVSESESTPSLALTVMVPDPLNWLFGLMLRVLPLSVTPSAAL